MKTQKRSTKTFLFAAAFLLIGFATNVKAQTAVGTFQVMNWFEEVFNTVSATGVSGAYANIDITGTNQATQHVRIVAIKDGHTPPANGLKSGVLFVYYTEVAYNRAIDCLQRGQKVEFRWDGNATTGYLRQYK